MANLESLIDDPIEFFDDLLKCICAIEYNFREEVEGASSVEIEQYRLATGSYDHGLSMPLFYTTFLNIMGRRHGQLFRPAGLNLDIGTLLRVYRSFSETEPDLIYSALPIVGSDFVGDQIAFNLLTPVSDPEVVSAAGDEIYGWYAESWAHLIVQSSVLYLEPLKRKAKKYFSSSRASAMHALGADLANQSESGRQLDRLVLELGLASSWASDRAHRIAYDSQTVLHAELGVKGEVMVRVYSDNPAIFPRIERFAADALGATGGEF